MRYASSLHIKTKDLDSLIDNLRSVLDRWHDSFVVPGLNWTSVYTPKLEWQNCDVLFEIIRKLAPAEAFLAIMIHAGISVAIVWQQHDSYPVIGSNDPEIFGFHPNNTLSIQDWFLKVGIQEISHNSDVDSWLVSVSQKFDLQYQYAWFGLDDFLGYAEAGSLPAETIFIEAPKLINTMSRK